MSLNRVTSLETLTLAAGHQHLGNERRGSNASVQVQKLTFNPVPPEWDVLSHRGDEHHHHEETVGAFEVPAWKRKGELCFIVQFLTHGDDVRLRYVIKVLSY